MDGEAAAPGNPDQPRTIPEEVRELLGQLTNEDDATGGPLEPPGPFIRHKVPGLPDTIQHKWWSPPVPGPEVMVGSELPQETVRVLMAANILRQLGQKAEHWARAREAVEATAGMTVPDWPVEDGYASPVLRVMADRDPFSRSMIEGQEPSEDLQAFERVVKCLEVMEASALWAKRVINEAGYNFKWTDGVLKNGKKQALGISVEELLAGRDDLEDLSPDDHALQKTLARELGPFFPATRLDPGVRQGVLRNTIHNARVRLLKLRRSSGAD